MTEQIELFVIDNPCIGRCESNKKGYCFGCLRSRSERQLWQRMTNEQRRDVLRLIQGRKKRIAILQRQKQQVVEIKIDQQPNYQDDLLQAHDMLEGLFADEL